MVIVLINNEKYVSPINDLITFFTFFYLQNFFPLALAVVDVKNDENWDWFA